LVILLVILGVILFNATGDTPRFIVILVIGYPGYCFALRAGKPGRQCSGTTKSHGPDNRHCHTGKARERITLKELVPGDIVVLAAGDMIPADVAVC